MFGHLPLHAVTQQREFLDCPCERASANSYTSGTEFTTDCVLCGRSGGQPCPAVCANVCACAAAVAGSLLRAESANVGVARDMVGAVAVEGVAAVMAIVAVAVVTAAVAVAASNSISNNSSKCNDSNISISSACRVLGLRLV